MLHALDSAAVGDVAAAIMDIITSTVED